jgi:hypothetical protein
MHAAAAASSSVDEFLASCGEDKVPQCCTVAIVNLLLVVGRVLVESLLRYLHRLANLLFVRILESSASQPWGIVKSDGSGAIGNIKS